MRESFSTPKPFISLLLSLAPLFWFLSFVCLFSASVLLSPFSHSLSLASRLSLCINFLFPFHSKSLYLPISLAYPFCLCISLSLSSLAIPLSIHLSSYISFSLISITTCLSSFFLLHPLFVFVCLSISLPSDLSVYHSLSISTYLSLSFFSLTLSLYPFISVSYLISAFQSLPFSLSQPLSAPLFLSFYPTLLCFSLRRQHNTIRPRLFVRQPATASPGHLLGLDLTPF